MPGLAGLLARDWIPETKGCARLVFGFLLFRHGLEQVFGYPPAFVDYEMASFGGVLKLIGLPGGLLIMLGLFTRPVSLTLAVLYAAWWLIGPLADSLTTGSPLFGAAGPSDRVLLNAFFLMVLAATGPGAWSADRSIRGRRDDVDSAWALYSLGALRIVAAFLFIHHGLGKVMGPNPINPASLFGVAAFLELVGGTLLMAGLFTRPLAFLLSGQMAVAYFLAHAPNGFWGSFASSNQQAAILNCFVFLFFWAAGPGAWSASSREESFVMKLTLTILGIILTTLTGTAPLGAHHGGAAFDQNQTLTFKGKVTEMTFTNPHVLVYWETTNGGTTEKWSGWLTAPTKLARAGWTKTTLKPGDEIEVTGIPHKGGSHILQIRRLVAPDGKALPLSEN